MRRLQLLGPVRVDEVRQPTLDDEWPTELDVEDQIPNFRSRRTVALLGYLAAERRPVAREALAALFWPDKTISDGRGSLRRELHNLGNVLPDCWQLDRQSAAFAPSETTQVDIDALRSLEDEARWVEAADLLAGEFLEGIALEDNAEFEHWLQAERQRWRTSSQNILNRVVKGYIRRGRYSEALEQARRLLQLTPSNEASHQLIMRLLAWTGQPGAAMQQFEHCKQALREDLSVEPSVETIELAHEIRQGKLEIPPQLPAYLTDEKARHEFKRPPFVGRELELANLDSHLERAMQGNGRVVFITGGPGRGKTALLDSFAQRSLEAHTKLLVAGGKCHAYSGVGDPFLPFREVMAMLTGDVENLWDAGTISRDHAQRLWASMPITAQAILNQGPHLLDTLVPGTPLLSRAETLEAEDKLWISRLRECIRQARTFPEELVQSYLFEQATRVLLQVTRSRPLLLKLDDLQWADPASISLLFHLGRRLIDAEARLMILCAYRPEEVAVNPSPVGKDENGRHPLTKVINELKRGFGDVWIDLGHPEKSRARDFIDALLDTEPNQLSAGFRTALTRRTEGHPLFTVELLRAMQARGDLVQDEGGRWIEGPALNWDLFPARVEAVIGDRISRLSPKLQRILEVASVEGESFTAQVLAQALGIPENAILRSLSQALERQHRLVKEEEEVVAQHTRISRFRFGHALFKDYLYNRLSAGEKRLIHGQVAKALEDIHQGHLEEMAVQLARHFFLADHLEPACQYYALAAERASRFYANEEVLSHYSQAIELAEQVSPDSAFLARLHRGRGLVLERIGEFDAALSDLTLSLQTAQSSADQEMSWISLIDLGRLWAARDYQHTRAYLEDALKLAREMNDPLVLASSLNWMGNWHMNMENPHKATSYHLEALQIVERIDDKGELANTLDLLGVTKLMEGDLAASRAYYDRAIALQRELEDRLRLVTSLTGRAGTASSVAYLVSSPAATPSQAKRDIEEALQIADETGLASGQAWALYIQGMLHVVQGQYGRAQEILHQGLQLASQLDHYEYIVANHFGLGSLYNEMLTPRLSRKHTEECLRIAEELRSPAMIHYSIGVRAGSLILQNELHTAQDCLDKVLTTETLMDTLGKCLCWIRRAELALALGNPEHALDITNRLIVAAPGSKPNQVITYIWKIKGEALIALDRTGEAISSLEAALESAASKKEIFLMWKLHASLGRAYQMLGQQSEAESEQAQAREQIQRLAKTLPSGQARSSFINRANEQLTTRLQIDHS